MTFTEILQSEFYPIIEAIEHGCSDPAIMEMLINELYEKTGYKYEL